MNADPLSPSVEHFARCLVDTPDAALDRPWGWQSYDSEGVRFAFFRTYEDLRDLAVRLAQQRSAGETLITEAQRILAQYHAAYRDLQSSILGLTQEQMETPPAEKEWPVRGVLAHVLVVDIGFYVAVRFALDRLRGGVGKSPFSAAERGGEAALARPTEEDWARLSGLDESAINALMGGPLVGLLAYYDRHHARVINTFATIGAEELDGLAMYWEEEPYPLRFRLRRFDSHVRQHTIQVDKTLAPLGLLPTETRRLLRLVYSALAEVEGALIGTDPCALPEIAETAQKIDARLVEMEAALASSKA